MRIAIIGAGAAGCFCAINLKRKMPEAEVCIYEKGPRPLMKVALTGGGRCNLTNSFKEVKSMEQVYPRGARLMKRALNVFSHKDTMQWFEQEGIALVTQEDQCVFPKSQDAMEIVETLTRLIRESGIRLCLNYRIEDIRPLMKDYDRVVVTTGGSPRLSGISFLNGLGLKVTDPVPSLFTFHVADKALQALMGTVVEDAACKLTGTKIQSTGPLLITHWGLSGPAILKLSSHGAQWLAERDYKADLCINWMGKGQPDDVAALLQDFRETHGRKQCAHIYPQCLNQRLWLYLLQKAGLSPERRWSETGSKQINRLTSILTGDVLHISGRGTFKDEFVTCGGVSLENIDIKTMECRQYPGLYFAGEVLDVDALTGGFNLQAAWSMGYIVAQHITQQPSN